MEIKNNLIDIIANAVDDDQKESAKTYLQNNNDISKLGINSIDYIKIIVDIEMYFKIELQDELYEMTYFSYLDLLCEYVDECVNKGTGGNKLLIKIKQIKEIENKFFDKVSEKLSSDQLENLKIVRDLAQIYLEDEEINSIFEIVKREYEIKFNDDEINNYELNKVSNLSRYIFNNSKVGDKA